MSAPRKRYRPQRDAEADDAPSNPFPPSGDVGNASGAAVAAPAASLDECFPVRDVPPRSAASAAALDAAAAACQWKLTVSLDLGNGKAGFGWDMSSRAAAPVVLTLDALRAAASAVNTGQLSMATASVAAGNEAKEVNLIAIETVAAVRARVPGGAGIPDANIAAVRVSEGSPCIFAGRANASNPPTSPSLSQRIMIGAAANEQLMADNPNFSYYSGFKRELAPDSQQRELVEKTLADGSVRVYRMPAREVTCPAIGGGPRIRASLGYAIEASMAIEKSLELVATLRNVHLPPAAVVLVLTHPGDWDQDAVQLIAEAACSMPIRYKPERGAAPMTGYLALEQTQTGLEGTASLFSQIAEDASHDGAIAQGATIAGIDVGAHTVDMTCGIVRSLAPFTMQIVAATGTPGGGRTVQESMLNMLEPALLQGLPPGLLHDATGARRSKFEWSILTWLENAKCDFNPDDAMTQATFDALPFNEQYSLRAEVLNGHSVQFNGALRALLAQPGAAAVPGVVPMTLAAAKANVDSNIRERRRTPLPPGGLPPFPIDPYHGTDAIQELHATGDGAVGLPPSFIAHHVAAHSRELTRSE